MLVTTRSYVALMNMSQLPASGTAALTRHHSVRVPGSVIGPPRIVAVMITALQHR